MVPRPGRLTLRTVRDREAIDTELRLLAAARWSIREQDGQPGSLQVDELLDERASREN